MIPRTRCWRASVDGVPKWYVWAPTRRLASLHLLAEGIFDVDTIARYAAGDVMSIPRSLVVACDQATNAKG